MNSHAVCVIAKKELSGLASEKTILLAVLLQVFIAVFSSFLIVGLAALYNPDSVSGLAGVSFRVGYSGPDTPLAAIIEEREDFELFRADETGVLSALAAREVAAAISVPDTAPGDQKPMVITVYLIEDDLLNILVGPKLKSALLAYEEELREVRTYRLDERPISLVLPEPEGTGLFEFVYGLLIPLLLFLPAVISSAMVIDLITEEHHQQTLEVLMAAPLTYTDVVFGKALAAFVLVPVQAAAWIVLLALNGITVGSPAEIMLQVSASGAVLVLVGVLTAVIFPERTTAQAAYSGVLVVLILLALAMPGNPVNQVALLASGLAAQSSWYTFVLLAAITGALIVAIHRIIGGIRSYRSDAVL
jgi:ABC-2 type transport system permease protein